MNIERNRSKNSKLKLLSNGENHVASKRHTSLALDHISKLHSQPVSPLSFRIEEPSKINFIHSKPIGVKGAKQHN